MGNTGIPQCDRQFETLISDFCDIVLTTKDCLSHSEAELYVKNLTNVEKSCLNQYKETDFVVQECVKAQVIEYIQKFQDQDVSDLGSPFEFDSGTNYAEYRDFFERKYREFNNNASLPEALKYAFDHIKEMSDHYRVFEQFYVIRTKQAFADIWKRMKVEVRRQAKLEMGKAISQSVEEAAQSASERANSHIEKLAEEAKGNAEKAVGEAVEKQMLKVSAKVTETSVTILGIFAGIVLTVVAGLFYSSSVIENATNANFYRLMSVSALVGFVCFNLIAIMFRYISKLKGNPEKAKAEEGPNGNTPQKNTPRFPLSKMSLFVSITLVVIMVVFAILE